MSANSEVLNSWKEVATYLGRGVRTVQRWEQELGLPVRRPRGKSRSAVIAFRNELDQWLHHAPGEIALDAHPPLPHGSSKSAIQLHDNTARLIARTQQLLNHSTELCERMNDMRDQVARAVQLTMSQVKQNVKNNQVAFAKSSPPAKWSYQPRRQFWQANHPETGWQIRHPPELATQRSSRLSAFTLF